MVVETTTKKLLNWFLGATGTLISDYNFASNNTTIIYTVPANKILLVTAVSLSYFTNGATISDTALLMLDGRDTLSLSCGNSTSDSGSTSLNFIPPVRLTAGQKVEVFTNGVNMTADGYFAGYLIDT